MLAVAVACVFAVTGEVAAARATPTTSTATPPSSDGRLLDDIPDDARAAQVAVAGEPAAITLSATDSGTATGLVTDAYGAPVRGQHVTVTAASEANPTLVESTASSANGRFSVNLPLLSGRYAITAAAGTATSPAATVANDPTLTVSASVPTTASEGTSRVQVNVTDLNRPANAQVHLTSNEPVGPATSYSGTTGADGSLTIDVPLWRNPALTVVATRNGGTAATTVTASTSPTRKPAPTAGPQPRTAHPLTNRPIGTSANAQIARISDAQWATMRGVSWQPGCIARTKLRMVDVNYIGFDGYRHRGRLIVNKSIASKIARIFTRLHARAYPIRQIRPVDSYGKNVGRPGANDYKSMAAGNTSGFNCRYVVGKERAKARSPHASGRSLDINPWENPYVARNGVYPNRHYLNRKRTHPAVFKHGRVALKIVKQGRCRWGGSFADYHHFDC